MMTFMFTFLITKYYSENAELTIWTHCWGDGVSSSSYQLSNIACSYGNRFGSIGLL